MTQLEPPPTETPAPNPVTPVGKVLISVQAGRVLLALLDSVRLPGGQLKVQVGMAETELAAAMAPYMGLQRSDTEPTNRASRRRNAGAAAGR